MVPGMSSLLGLILMAESNASLNSARGIFQGCSWQIWHYLNALLQLEVGKTLGLHVSSKVITWLWVSTTFWKLLWCLSRIKMWDIKSCLKSETQSTYHLDDSSRFSITRSIYLPEISASWILAPGHNHHFGWLSCNSVSSALIKDIIVGNDKWHYHQ